MIERLLIVKKRLRTNPKYKYFLIEKIFENISISIISGLLFPFRYILLGRVYFTSRIHLDTSFKNFKNIKISGKVKINKGVVLWAGINKGITIEDSTQINPYTTIYGDVKFGKFVMIAPHVMLAGGSHGYKDINTPMIFQPSESKGGIDIEDDVWIGANSTIVDGIKVGKGAIIAAGSVVNKNVSPYDIVAGIPARVIKNRLDLNIQ